jgi:hypothetical protein
MKINEEATNSLIYKKNRHFWRKHQPKGNVEKNIDLQTNPKNQTTNKNKGLNDFLMLCQKW